MTQAGLSAAEVRRSVSQLTIGSRLSIGKTQYAILGWSPQRIQLVSSRDKRRFVPWGVFIGDLLDGHARLDLDAPAEPFRMTVALLSDAELSDELLEDELGSELPNEPDGEAGAADITDQGVVLAMLSDRARRKALRRFRAVLLYTTGDTHQEPELERGTLAFLGEEQADCDGRVPGGGVTPRVVLCE